VPLTRSGVFRLPVGIVSVPAKPNINRSDKLLGPRRVLARDRDATVPVSQVHRRLAVTGAHVIHLHGGVAQLHLHGNQHDQSDLGGKRNENEGMHISHGRNEYIFLGV